LKRIVVISDLQVPYHDPKAVKNVAKFIAKYKPDQVLCVGDELDMPQLGKFNIGRGAEYFEDLGKDRDTCADILYDLKIDVLVRSNHQQRLYNSIASRLPSLLKLPELEYEKFLRLDELGIYFSKEPYAITKNTIMVHGDEQAYKPQGGLTALEAARRHGKNVVCGHTHRQGYSAFTEASGGVLGRTVWGFEVGNMVNERSPGMKYMKGVMNWQKGFGILYVDGDKVSPVPIPIERDGSFRVEGKRYG
jgi:predicted phosphodiesterase